MKTKILFFSFFVAIFFFACKKDGTTHIDKYAKYPITLTGISAFEAADLTWTAVKSPDFVQYQIFQSITQDSIKDNLENGFLVATIGDSETSNLTTTDNINNGFPKFDYTYYRVVAKLKDRVILSNNVLITKTSYLDYDGSMNSSFFYDKTSNCLLFKDAKKAKLVKINLVTKNIESSALPIAVSSINKMLTYTVNGNKEIAMSSGYNLYIFDFNTLDLKKSIGLDGSIYAMTSDEKGIIYCADYKNMFIIDASAGSFKVYSFIDSYSPSFVFLPNTNKMIFGSNNDFSGTAGDYYLSYLTMSDDHKSVESESPKVTQNFPGNFNSATTIVFDENTYLMPSLLSIKDKNFVEIGIIPSQSSITGNSANTESLVAVKNKSEFYLSSVNNNLLSNTLSTTITLNQNPNKELKSKKIPNIAITGIFSINENEVVVVYKTNILSSNSGIKFEKLKF